MESLIWRFYENSCDSMRNRLSLIRETFQRFSACFRWNVCFKEEMSLTRQFRNWRLFLRLSASVFMSALALFSFFFFRYSREFMVLGHLDVPKKSKHDTAPASRRQWVRQEKKVCDKQCSCDRPSDNKIFKKKHFFLCFSSPKPLSRQFLRW